MYKENYKVLGKNNTGGKPLGSRSKQRVCGLDSKSMNRERKK